MTEREDGFLRAVLELASVLGWRAFHPRPARTAQGWATAFSGDAGYVDLTLARSGSPIVFAELKVARRLPTDAQVAWLETLRQAQGHTVHLWYPNDWSSIEALLRGNLSGGTR